jgi:RAB protein geranylgeranyltransferase component A
VDSASDRLTSWPRHLYTPAGKTKVTSRVVRAMCIMSHPIPNTDNAHSVQIILPQKQIGRRSGGCVAGCWVLPASTAVMED